MENKVVSAKKNKEFQTGFPLILFPWYFKRIGIVLVVTSFLIPLVFAALKWNMFLENKEIFRTAENTFRLLGLVFIAWSKDKTEDEMSIYMKFKSLGLTFYITVFVSIIRPIINLHEAKSTEQIQPHTVIESMLTLYILHYYFSKKGLK